MVHTVIGAHSYEQCITQLLRVDLSFLIDLECAGKRDLLCDTHDYAAVCASIVTFANHSRCRLLETFSKKLSEHLKQQFQLSILHLAVTKHPSDLPGVSVQVVQDNPNF